jgi:hypothetical protein
MQQILAALKAQCSLPVTIVIQLIRLVKAVLLVMAVAASAQALHIMVLVMAVAASAQALHSMELLAVTLIVIAQANQSAQRSPADDINMSQISIARDSLRESELSLILGENNEIKMTK